MTTTTVGPTPGNSLLQGRQWHAYRAHLLNETRLHAREPAALIFGAILPVTAIIVMCVFPAAREPVASMGGVSVITAYTPVLILFSSSILGLTIIPGTLGTYRESGVLRRLRTTPTSPLSLLTALITIISGFALLVAGVIVGIPAISGAGMPTHLGWFSLAAAVSTICFVAMGALIASVVSNAKAAPGIGNAIAVVMWAASGMWFPRAGFPDWLRTVADLTPGGATAQLMLDASTTGSVEWQPFMVLLVWTLVSTALATRLFRWE